MNIKTKITDSGAEKVLTRITALSQFGSRSTMQGIAKSWLSLVRDGFASESAPDGTPWEKLRIRTVRRKRKIGAPQPSRRLFEFGTLSKSFFVSAGPKRLRIESSDDPVKVNRHQFGEGKVPARPMLPEPDNLPESWNAAIANEIVALRLRILR